MPAKDPFKLSNVCTSQHTAPVQTDGGDDQPAVEDVQPADPVEK